MKVYKLLNILLISVLTVNYSNAKEWNVSSVKDIQNTLNKCAPGDVLIMTNGTWKDATIVFKANGTQENPIVLAAETPGKVILTGTSTITYDGNYLEVTGLYFIDGIPNTTSVVHFKQSSNYCSLSNCAIVNYNQADQEKVNKWVVLEGGTHNKVEHCYFKNKVGRGPLISVEVTPIPNYHEIDSNYFAYRPPLKANDGNSGEIIRISADKVQNYVSGTRVEHNYFEECNGEVETISSKTCDNTFRDNTFRRCQGTLSLRNGDSCLVEGNYFLGENVPNTGGVTMFGSGHKIINNYFYQLTGKDLYAALAIMNGSSTLKGLRDGSFDLYQPVKNVMIENNTFLENRQNIVVGLAPKWHQAQRDLLPKNIVIQNNVFSTSDEPFINLVSKDAQEITAEANAYNKGSIGLNTNGGNNAVNLLFKKQQNLSLIANENDLPPVKINSKSVQVETSQNNRSNMKIGSQLAFSETANKPLTGKEVGVNWLIE